MPNLQRNDEIHFASNHEDVKTVHLIDKNPVLADMLAMKLNELGNVRCSFQEVGSDLIQASGKLKPDVLFLDPMHLKFSGNFDLIDFCRAVRSASPKTKLLAYSFNVTDNMLRAVLDAGFRGCVSKGSDFDRVKIALSAVLSGGIFLDQGFGSHLRPTLGEPADLHGLSAREKDVLVALARGLSSKQIAQQLDISNKTVDTYKSRASKKLKLMDRAEIVEFVNEQGWLD
ncbi:MAG: response regulator transcription factor [Litoreibacter sp.]|uniref:response regulator transcription factor n=1 Tax=Litoreibacter sp. TaxID=1969459 RepID=UPI00329929B6